MGERLLCKQEVIGSIPFTSTIPDNRKGMGGSVDDRTRREDVIRDGALERLAGLLIERVKRRVVRDRGGRRLGRGHEAMSFRGLWLMGRVPFVCRKCLLEKWLPCPAVSAAQFPISDFRYL